jgi:caffeoyl-CoA O-methyltransferase
MLAGIYGNWHSRCMRKPVVDPALEAYAAAHTTPEPPYMAEPAAVGNELAPNMLTGQLEGRFLTFLVRMVGATRALDVGTFTGYSALSIAEGMGPEGRVITLEADAKHADVARRHFAASPHADRIELRFGPALDSMRTLDGPFDFVFIDADKTNYRPYYDRALELLSPQGLIAVDNTLWYQQVLDPAAGDDDTRAILAFNDHVVNDPRVECVVLTVRDGVTLVRKR